MTTLNESDILTIVADTAKTMRVTLNGSARGQWGRLSGSVCR